MSEELRNEKLLVLTRLHEALRAYEVNDLKTGDNLDGIEFALINRYIDMVVHQLELWEAEVEND